MSNVHFSVSRTRPTVKVDDKVTGEQTLGPDTTIQASSLSNSPFDFGRKEKTDQGTWSIQNPSSLTAFTARWDIWPKRRGPSVPPSLQAIKLGQWLKKT